VLPELAALGLSDRLAAVVTAEDVARGRPDPEAVLLAAQRLGRPPIRCVLIGELQTIGLPAVRARASCTRRPMLSVLMVCVSASYVSLC
jgi:beta-phosphoglucomutase-like phosphatase (HAD superfamily)